MSREYMVTVACHTAEELSQALRMAADHVMRELPQYVNMRVDQSTRISDSFEDLHIEVQRVG